MKNNIKQDCGKYYSGGLAEIVSQPSELTYSYLKKWFTGKKSIGKAMKLLDLPFEDIDLPILEIINGELMVNLYNEERTLYLKTIFVYKKQNTSDDVPQLKISLKKTVNLKCLYNSLRILLVQSKWIANPNKSLNFAKELFKKMPETLPIEKDPEIIIMDELLPSLIAIGIMTEFFQQLLYKEYPKEIQNLQNYIAKKISFDDWFFRSLSDQAKVKNNKLSLENYIKLYGIRADKDYELMSPRWYEIPGIIKKRIENFNSDPNQKNFILNIKNISLADIVASFQIIRSEAKRKTLIFIDLLRKSINKTTFIFEKGVKKTGKPNMNKKYKRDLIIHKGVPVYKGIVAGKVLVIDNNSITVPENTIGIFPNASPEFAVQYPKCKGMIFLKGGQTSHGAIVAREFGIPALIDHEASGLSNNQEILLDGERGEWKIANTNKQSVI